MFYRTSSFRAGRLNRPPNFIPNTRVCPCILIHIQHLKPPSPLAMHCHNNSSTKLPDTDQSTPPLSSYLTRALTSHESSSYPFPLPVNSNDSQLPRYQTHQSTTPFTLSVPLLSLLISHNTPLFTSYTCSNFTRIYFLPFPSASTYLTPPTPQPQYYTTSDLTLFNPALSPNSPFSLHTTSREGWGGGNPFPSS